MKTALVLGAGGTVGLASHVGALRALAQAGLDPGGADLIVGTSAGAVVAAYLRAGWSVDDLWDLAHGTDPLSEAMTAAEIAASRRRVMTPLVRTPVELVRRGLGTAYVLARSALRLPAPRVPAPLARAFPAGLFGMDEGHRRFEHDLPVSWPDAPLWLCTVDIERGTRVVLGRADGPLASLRSAVAASCAIPGVYPPVRVGRRVLVDGGVHSMTNLDLAARGRFDLVVCLAPMAFDPERPPARSHQLVRRIPTRQLAAEAARLRSEGTTVLLVRPAAAEVDIQGINLMRRSESDLVARAAYEGTAELVATDRFRHALAGHAAA